MFMKLLSQSRLLALNGPARILGPVSAFGPYAAVGCGLLSLPQMTRMYGPAVRRKRFSSSWRWAVLHQCIRPLIGARWAPSHHGNQRAGDLISGQASVGHSGHQCSQAPGRPILHLVSSSRRPRRVIRLPHRVLLILR
jgi:hypothetical protein